MYSKLEFFTKELPSTTQFAQKIPRMLIRINIFLVLVFLDLNAQIPKKKTELEKKAKEVSISKINRSLTYYIVFEKGKTELNSEMKQKLDRVAKVFKNNINDTLNIMSNTQKTSLYKERSISVNNYLISKGVPPPKIRFIEVGKLKAAREIQIILKE